jgi:hypothetical protein
MQMKEGIMFDHKILSFQNIQALSESPLRDNHVLQYNIALSTFKLTVRKGSVSRLIKTFLHRSSQLYDLNALKPELHLRGSSYAGIQVVPIRLIIGSEGRSADFDIDFHPRSERARARWVNIAMAFLSCMPLPPVQLIRVGDAYFVRDGHHRVSVSRAFGQAAVDAEVITWKASPPFPWHREALQKRRIFSEAVT